MAVITDNVVFARRVLPTIRSGNRCTPARLHPRLRSFVGTRAVRVGDAPAPWSTVFVARHASRSNYDRLIDAVRDGAPLPDRLVCIAGSGHGFHGYKGRRWAAVPGNVHVSVHLRPEQAIERFEIAFTALAAVSVVEAIDGMRGLEGRAGIRWVNDIVLDGAKAGGVLAYTHARADTVNAAILGIGVNVGARPAVEPTPFVPAVTCLREHAPAGPPLLPNFYTELLGALDRNYRTLLRDGHHAIVESYRRRSVVVGRDVLVCAEDSDAEPRVLTRGTVRAVGGGLELYLRGRETPVTRGRLVLGDHAVRKEAV